MANTEDFCSTRFGRVRYVDQGEGEPLVLLHSNGCSHHEFDPALPLLARHFRCIAWDMPGHGDSDRPTGHLSVMDYADAVLALMDGLGIDDAHVCGASIGGMVCVALGARAPQRMRSVVIAEAPLRTRDEWAAQWARIEAMFGTPRQDAAEIAPRLRQVTPALVQRWNLDREKAGAWRMIDVMWALRDFDAAGHLARIGCPAAVLIGDRGPVIGSRAAYAAALPAAPMRILADAGHFPMIDDPVGFADGVRSAIAEATAATRAKRPAAAAVPAGSTGRPAG